MTQYLYSISFVQDFTDYRLRETMMTFLHILND